MPTAQAIIYLDSAGTIRAELPGLNGTRRKLDLPANFAARNPELLAALRETLSARIAQDAKIAALRAAEASRPHQEAQTELDKRNADLAAREKKRRDWLDSLPAPQRALEEKKLQDKRDRAIAAANARAKGLYLYVASEHGIRLANRVIPNPDRRPGKPRKRILVSGPTGMQEVRSRANAPDLSLAIDL